MPSSYKVLGQSSPLALTNTTVYTVPAGASSVISTLVVANRGLSTAYKVAVVPSGQTLENKHYVFFDNTVNQFESLFVTIGITLAMGDTIVVNSGSADLSFSVFGTEITA